MSTFPVATFNNLQQSCSPPPKLNTHLKKKDKKMELDFTHMKLILYTEIHWSYTVVSEDSKWRSKSAIFY